MGKDEWLEFTAKLSIYSSVLIVIYFLGHYFVRIARFPNPPWKIAKNRAVEVYKKPVELSYVLKLKEDTIHTTDTVTFNLKANGKTKIKLFWGVSVVYIFDLMRCSWKDFQKVVQPDAESSKIQCETCHAMVDHPLETSTDGTFDDLISVSPPSSLNWDGLRNKYRYPLVIVAYREDALKGNNESNQEDGSEIHGLFTILHVKSEAFPAPTSVLAHYVKMDNGSTFLLKPLYLVEDDNADDSSSTSFGAESPAPRVDELSSFPGVSCSVCQTLPVSRAILPCGHVCLCVLCFEKVERCPICRGEMQFFFRTRDEDYATSVELENLEPPRHRSLLERLDDWNTRINYWLGFRD